MPKVVNPRVAKTRSKATLVEASMTAISKYAAYAIRRSPGVEATPPAAVKSNGNSSTSGRHFPRSTPNSNNPVNVNKIPCINLIKDIGTDTKNK